MSETSPTRFDLRAQSADRLNALSKSQLFEFGITRVSYLTHLDTVRIPVYSAIRPLSRTICVSGGKAFKGSYARAGAIAEAIEYQAGENPEGSPFEQKRWIDVKDPPVPFEKLQLSRYSVATPRTVIALSPVTRLDDGKVFELPSDLIWMHQRVYTPLNFFQMGSNGLAAGPTVTDATITALYELIERDAWTLAQISFMYFQVLPQRVDLEGHFPELLSRIKDAGLELYLFDTTTDLGIPCYWAMLADPVNWVGTFAGHGCSLYGEEAARRAILESIQSRAIYISGARDDLFRRGFTLLKKLDQAKANKELEVIPAITKMRTALSQTEMLSPELELWHILNALPQLIRHRLFRAVLKIDPGILKVVRVISTELEGYRSLMWTPGERSKALLMKLSATPAQEI